jgi:hypothetical protein
VGYRTYQGRKQMKEKSPLRQKDIRTGAQQERERILKAIEDAPPALDFFGPYIAKEKLIALIKGED